MDKAEMTLYGDEASPPMRFVQMTASVIGAQVKQANVDLFKNENQTAAYEKINPLRKVPALRVGDNVLVDSHAIALFLCETHKDNSLYPSDVMTRAKVLQFLFFNSTTLFPIDSAIFTSYFASVSPMDEKLVQNWYSALDFLELKLRANKWLAGEKMTLGDLCCATTVSTLQLLVPPHERHEHVEKWLNTLQEQPFYDINERGLKRLQSFIDTMRQ